MDRNLTRRKMLGAGATVGLGSLAGCGGDGDSTGPGANSEANPNTTGPETEREQSEDGVPAQTGVLPAQFVVTKGSDEIRAYDGTTLEVAFRGEAGAEDGRVLQETFDATDGGRVFIRRGTYTVDRGLRIRNDGTEIRSDFARLAFSDHEPSGSAQVDFAVNSAEHVEVNGLVLDARKRERTGGTRTADIWGESAFVAYRNCVIFGGKSVDGNAGYGIGEDNDADYVTIDNCVIRDSDRHAYHPSAAHHRIVNSTFINNAQRTGDIFDLASTKAVVANNHFEANGHGIKIDDAGDAASGGNILITGNVFTDNYLEDVASGQIEFADTRVDSVTLSDNTFLLPDIDAEETSAHVLFDSNLDLGSVTFRNNYFAGGGRNALTWFTESGRRLDTLVFEHNTFEDISGDVGLLASANRLLFRDNLITCSGSRRGRLDIIESNTGVVSGNVCYNATIEVADGLNVIAERNHNF
ncbi:right-handed parallel beta-helix repeat-containing protein [Halorubrum sp. GN11_10-6_MGM]|uniref:right-handed parallel beta-helix repeat-containing protein n=1 Tax=Halorubrum sp. GN11_10-6_MGM TaxID=2518112 RepID=UPI0010F9516B|nr:right-handed parallel beta-helix repeat-containing protein [Halorubrum sp. GN11_10-6_MGM]TKX75197.1 right-handed parallel beta-helix repeat-containing protein [Halorubrum sp. GN11_10-6_MGM]